MIDGLSIASEACSDLWQDPACGARPPEQSAHWSICYLHLKWMAHSCGGRQWGQYRRSTHGTTAAAVWWCATVSHLRETQSIPNMHVGILRSFTVATVEMISKHSSLTLFKRGHSNRPAQPYTPCFTQCLFSNSLRERTSVAASDEWKTKRREGARYRTVSRIVQLSTPKLESKLLWWHLPPPRHPPGRNICCCMKR